MIQHYSRAGFPEKLEELSKTRFVEHLNTYSGWGKFTLNKDTIIITAPIFTKPHFLQGFLEGTLNLNLTTLETNQTRTILTINKN